MKNQLTFSNPDETTNCLSGFTFLCIFSGWDGNGPEDGVFQRADEFYSSENDFLAAKLDVENQVTNFAFWNFRKGIEWEANLTLI